MRIGITTGLLFSMLLLAACNVQRSSPPGEISEKSPFLGIYNGKVAASQDLIARSTVIIEGDKFDGGLFHCTGSVLSPTIILTAGHCVTDTDVLAPGSFLLPPEKIFILDQEHNGFSVERILVNPGFIKELEAYRSTLVSNSLLKGYDLALIKLSKALPDFYQPVSLSTDVNAVFSEQSFVAGFGISQPTIGSKSDHRLRKGPVQMESAGISTEREVVNTPYSRLLYYKKQSQSASICEGDSGGPLFYEKAGRIVQFGVNIEFRFAKGEKRSCATDKDHQVSAFLAGGHRQFIADAYKELAGEKLANFEVPAADQDPARFEFYLNNHRGQSKNSFLDLSKASILITENTLMTRNYEVVYDLSVKTPKEKICEISALTANQIRAGTASLDGQSALSFVKLVNGSIDASFEARVLDQGNRFHVIVLTPEGVVNATLPVLKCP